MNKKENTDSYKPYGDLAVELPSPPPCFTNMKGRFIAAEPGKELTVAFPVFKEYCNPAGSMQGGYISAAFDNVFGPLCHLASKTPVSAMVHMNTSYHRPVFPDDELTITGKVKSKGNRKVHMEADAHNREGKLVATAHCDYLVTG